MRQLSFVFLLLSYLIAVAFSANITIDIVSIGVITAAIGTSYASQGPPLDASVEEIQANFPQISFRHVHLKDPSITNCVQLNTNVERMLAQWYYGRTYQVNMTVLMNAACLEGALINRMAAGWNCLYVSSSGYDYNAIRNRPADSTYVVTSSTAMGGYANLCKMLLQRYNWTTVFVVIDDDSLLAYTVLADAIVLTLQQDINLKPLIRHIDKSWQADDPLTNLFKDFSLRSRGGRGKARYDQRRAYLYHAVDQNTGPSFNPQGNVNAVIGSADDNVTAGAYQSVLVMEPFDIDAMMPQDILQRYPEFEARSVRDYNITYNLTRRGRPDVTFSYLSGLLYGKILNETLLDNGNLSDGTAFAQRFLRRTLQTRIGSFFMSANGELQTVIGISHFNHTSSRREKFLVLRPGSSSLDEISGHEWNGSFNKGVPPNEPFCGFGGNNPACHVRRDQAAIWSTLSAGLVIALLGYV